jgi:YHS domain-containing protein
MNLGSKSCLALLLAVVLWPCAASGQPASRYAANPFQPRQAAPGPKLPVAADGFCVVTLHDRQAWQRGNPAFGALFDNRQYLFASSRELEIFGAAPIVYAPVLGGDCVVTYAETGERVAGDRQFGSLRGGRLYFFATREAQERFAATPLEYIDADLADDGKCLVSRVDRRRNVDGLPSTAVLCDGLRRLFAGAYEQRLYLENPERYDRASATPGARALASSAGGGDSTASEQPPAAPDDTSAEGEAAGADAAEAETDEDESLAPDPLLGGYCPETIRTKGAWVRGRYEDHVRIETLDFLTAGPEEHDALLADPAKYVPVLAGDCAVSWVDQDKSVRGSIFHAAEYQGRLFLFADAAHKAAFKADPAKYAMVDVAAGGSCVVTLAEKDRTEAGFAEFATWYNGKLYRFAGAEQLKKFLATPERYAVRESK